MHARGFGCYNLGVFLGRLAFSLILFPSAFAKGEREIEFVRVGTSRAVASRLSGCAEGHTACVTGFPPTLPRDTAPSSGGPVRWSDRACAYVGPRVLMKIDMGQY